MKSFKDFANEDAAAMSTSAGVAGLGPGEVADWKRPKKKRSITKSYIEIMGKRKKIVK